MLFKVMCLIAHVWTPNERKGNYKNRIISPVFWSVVEREALNVLRFPRLRDSQDYGRLGCDAV
jgi:hypothetical protein